VARLSIAILGSGTDFGICAFLLLLLLLLLLTLEVLKVVFTLELSLLLMPPTFPPASAVSESAVYCEWW
jgi:hypothetical protein